MDSISDEETKTEYRINDFEVVNCLFEVLEESDENLTYLLLETIFLLAKVSLPNFHFLISYFNLDQSSFH